jgi:histidine ammonia-lyase
MAQFPLPLTGRDLTPADLAAVARQRRAVAVAPTAWQRLEAGRAVVEAMLAGDAPVYGLNTGLGERVVHRLPADVLAEFSRLTVLGRADAAGPALPAEAARAAMAARLNGLVLGAAGASPAVARHLEALLNAEMHPLIPAQGSIGAGDLCQLAHIGLGLVGEGEMEHRGEILPAGEALARAGLKPLALGPKDGLALINASSVTAGRAALVLEDAAALMDLMQIAAALSMEGYRANLSPIDPRVVAARPAPGQEAAATELRAMLVGGALTEPGAARRVQDPISLRCVAPCHGAVQAALDFARPAVDAELNGSSDNPMVLIEDGEMLSTGNFHTPALALALDTLCLALAQAAALCLARWCKLLFARLSGLPGNLSPHAPARSGMAPLMKTGEALMGEIRHEAQPSPGEVSWAADGVEDHRTNAPLAARRAESLIGHMRRLVAIELLVAAQAVDLAAPPGLGRGTAAAHAAIRAVVAPLDQDRSLAGDIARIERELVSGAQLSAAVRAAMMG